jgi:short-chain fatty acids transporter
MAGNQAAQPTGDASFLNQVMRGLAAPFVAMMQRWMPNAFIFATLLTILTFVICIFLTEASAGETIDAWGNGFWNLIAFTTQIAMTLITGYALAHTPAVHSLLRGIARLASSPSKAYVIVCITAIIGSLVSWGIGLIVGAIIARQTATVCRERGIPVHFPLLVAAGYAGFVVWHQGLSSSTGLAIATDGHFLIDQIGIIPVSETLFTYWNFIIVVAVAATLPFVMMLLRPADKDCVPMPADTSGDEDEEDDEQAQQAGGKRTPAQILDNARILNLLIGAAGVVYLYFHFISRGGSLNLNIINFLFLIAGILLTRSPLHYVELVTHGGRTLGPILLQYPFYAGIMGMMLDTGLAKVMAGWFVAISTAHTLPFWSMISSGLINLFVPSGGGQWAVQGPVMIEAASELGADLPRVAMGVAIGDQWTNMIQPFWTIPALAIAGLGVRDIMGYTVIAFLWTGLIFAGGLLLL